MKEKISAAAARRIALGAQGFVDPKPVGTPDRRHFARVLSRTGLLQIDSVSAVVRAHYMPLYSRLGPYPMALLDNASVTRKRTVFEYWAHEASFLPVETWPLMRWRMERASRGDEMYLGLAKWGREHAAYIEEIHRQVAEGGPIPASALEGQKGSGGWWGWSHAKHAFEWLFWAGRITTAHRRGFERHYDLPERVLPQAVLDMPVPSAEDAHRELLRISARAHGIATAGDLRDYFRLSPADMKGRLEELVEAGEPPPLRGGGRGKPGHPHPGGPLPRRNAARAPPCPVDPPPFPRPRPQRPFAFPSRIEIYTPADKRQYGYYVLPSLLGDRIVARIALRADRPASVLRVHASYAEPCAPADTAAQLFEELKQMQGWLGLERIEVTPAGDLGPALADERR